MGRLLFLIFPFFLMACQPIHFASNEEANSKTVPLSGNDLSWEKEPVADVPISNELDLVFVLDGQPGMEKFYEKPLLAETFLSALDHYDVKMFHTNTAVDEKLLDDTFEEGDKCGIKNILRGTGLTVASVGFPILGPFAAQSLYPCFSEDGFKRSYPKVNGEFLPFELDGKKLTTQLAKGDADYQTVFQHTLTKNTGRLLATYDAPQSQGEDSYPLSAMLLSLAREASSLRENSIKIYVIVTSKDTSQIVSAEDIRKNFASIYKNQNQLYMIPLVIDEKDSLCELRMRELGVKSPQPGFHLSQIAEEMGTRSLNLCSVNLSQELSREIRNIFLFGKS